MMHQIDIDSTQSMLKSGRRLSHVVTLPVP